MRRPPLRLHIDYPPTSVETRGSIRVTDRPIPIEKTGPRCRRKSVRASKKEGHTRTNGGGGWALSLGIWLAYRETTLPGPRFKWEGGG